VYACLESSDDVGADLLEELAVARNEEDILAMIASERHVVERAGDVNARLAGHPCL
jgi:hypothetical protein